MFRDPTWFFTDEPTMMWGRQLSYIDAGTVREEKDRIVTPDGRRFSSLRRAFAIYRAGTGEKGPGDEQLEVMRRTMSWLHCRRYEQPVFKQGEKCPASARYEKVDDRRAICDIFGGSRPLYEHYLLHLELLDLVRVIDGGDYILNREGQAALIMLELTRKRSPVMTHAGWLRRLHERDRWITVDPNRWATGYLIASEGDDDD